MDSTRRLAAILFADVTGYTALMQQDEEQARTLLSKFRQVLTKQVNAANGQIVHFYGDGCLSIFDAPLDAALCALAIQRDFRAAPAIPVRVGLHSGTVMVEEGIVYGDAVNICSRIESLGIPGSVLLSQNIQEELKNHPEVQMQPLGKFTFKNVRRPREIYALAQEGLQVPSRNELQGKTRQTLALKWLLALPVALVLFLFGLWGAYQNISSPKEKAMLNSIAILPFTNMSPDEENKYFADGIHDDLLTHISKIGGLKVISRTSVNAYRNTQKTSPEIGAELGVATLMEGSVRHDGNTLRINVQLIKAETDEHLWSEIYDRELSTQSIFAIQTEIAREIASVLKTTLSPQQERALLEKPTESLEAYEAYLKGRQLLETRNAVSLREAQSLFEQAISLDSGFAQAYVHLGEVCQLQIEYGGADRETAKSLAWKYLNQGMTLNDNMAEAYTLKGFLIHIYEQNFERASQAFEKAIEINPNYGMAYLRYGNAIQDLKRDFELATKYHDKAMSLNPLSPYFMATIGKWYSILGGDPRIGIEVLNRLIALEPKQPLGWEYLSGIYRYQLGRLDSAAIVSYQGLLQNKNQNRFLRRHIANLLVLGMFQETAILLKTIPVSDRQDSLLYLESQRVLALYKSDFTLALNWDQQYLKMLGGDPAINSLSFEVLYANRDFFEAARLYESYYPNLQDGDHLGPLESLPLNRFQRYVYCLIQSGRKAEADALWAKFGQMVLTSPKDKDEYIWETRFREIFQLRQDLLEGRKKEGLEKLAALYSGGSLVVWNTIEQDPMLDSVRDHPQYQEIMKGLKKKIARQQENFKDYLAREQGHVH